MQSKCNQICGAIKDEQEAIDYYKDMSSIGDLTMLESLVINDITNDEVRHKNTLTLIARDNECDCV